MALSTPTAVVLELMTMGQQSAEHLRELLMAASPPMAAEHGQALTAEIFRCCDRVIAAISRGATGKKRKVTDRGPATCPTDLPLMPSKRARGGAEAHRVLETATAADGFVWRKYGQKDINGSNTRGRSSQSTPMQDGSQWSLTLFFSRFYYRCAYSGEGCGATRRVQQSRDEPAAFVIAYYGEHTCGDACWQEAHAAMPPAVVNSASNVWGGIGVDPNGGSPLLPLLHGNHTRHCHGEDPYEKSRGQWSSSSSSSDAEAELGTSPILEFLEGGLGVGWECVVNYLAFDCDLPRFDMLH
uniref:Uncharacterized protein n=1 Tax=Avena sativa TaxID=4498 RepID=A0ACD5VTY7_AVESA